MLIGTVIKTIDVIGTLPAGSLGFVFDEFDRGNAAGGSMGAQVILEDGTLFSMGHAEFVETFETYGFCARLGEYRYVSQSSVVKDFESGVFDPVFRTQDFRVFSSEIEKSKSSPAMC